MATGNGKNSQKYIIKPQATESGAQSEPANSQANSQPD
jgi:hypothetical protein